MSEFIILTAEEAEKLRGKTTPWTALDPAEMKDGTFILPVDVLTDPAHAAKFAGEKSRGLDAHSKQRRSVAVADIKAVEADAKGETRP